MTTDETHTETDNKDLDRTSGQEIVVCPDGPILVRGDFTIISTTGEEIPRRRQTVALCRCGASGIKPYCDGTHKLIGFRTEHSQPSER